MEELQVAFCNTGRFPATQVGSPEDLQKAILMGMERRHATWRMRSLEIAGLQGGHECAYRVSVQIKGHGDHGPHGDHGDHMFWPIVAQV